MKICDLYGIDIKKGIFHGLSITSLVITLILFNSNPIGWIFSGIYALLLSISFIVNKFFKSYEKILIQKLDESKEKLEYNFIRMKIQFSRIYNKTLHETKETFKELLVFSLADLGKIEKEFWIELNEKYKLVKKEILELSN